MGQVYLLGNLTKKQARWPSSFIMKAWELMANLVYQTSLALLLFQFNGEESLENSCLKFIARHDGEYPEGSVEKLPKHLQQKVKTTRKLTEFHHGKWAGDRVIITGSVSKYSPFPPDGEWRHAAEDGELYCMINESFSGGHVDTSLLWNEEFIRLCENKLHFIVNLDLKEYLDPRDYPYGEKNVLDFAKKKEKGIMAGLILKLIHSESADKGFPDYVTSQGSWAGCRIKICDAEEVDETFKNTSNVEDVEKALNSS